MMRRLCFRDFSFYVFAMICYVVLAIGVTAVSRTGQAVAQDASTSQAPGSESPAEEPPSKESDRSSSTNQADQKSGLRSRAGEDIEQQPGPSGSQLDQPSESSADSAGVSQPIQPVTVSKNEADDEPSNSLSKQSGAFDVVVPAWYSQLQAGNNPPGTVSFRVFGLDEAQLEAEIESQLQLEIDRFLDENVSEQARHFIRFSDDEKKSLFHQTEIVNGIYDDGQQRHPVDFCFAALTFDDAFQSLAKNKWVQQRQHSRLLQFGLIAGSAICLIGILFGGLKLNTATSGFYQGRLQFFAALVILGIISASLMFGLGIDWI